MPDSSLAQRILDGVDSSDTAAHAKAWEAADEHSEERAKIAKSAATGNVETVEFEATVSGSLGTLWKSDDSFVIWGPASVEVVDKENDRITAEALEKALPQLMKRQSLSYEHTDQIVGEVLDKFETEDAVDVEFGGKSVERTEFPTDVMKLDGMDNRALFVAGNVYGDTQKAREVRELAEEGEINSYSISGEAVKSSMSIEDGEPVTDISKLDLSAVTLCREGMNQLAKFGIVKKSLTEREGGEQAARIGFAKSAEGSDTVSADDAEALLTKTMGNDNSGGALTKSEMEEIFEKKLPEGDLATQEDVKHIAKRQAEQVVKENATNTSDEKEGTADRPDGDGSDNTEQDADYEGDADVNPAEDSDKVEEKSEGHPEGCMCEDCQTSKSVGMGEVKSVLKEKLPDDQYKAVEPLLEEDDEEMMVEEEEEDEEMMEPEDDGPEEEIIDPEEEMMAEEKARDLGFDPANLSDSQKKALAKSGDTETVGGVSFEKSGGSALDDLEEEPEDEDIAKAIEKAEGNTMAGSNFFDSDGAPKL